MIKFGTDGWRGVIAKDFTFDNVAIVAQAIADYLHQQHRRKKRMVIGYDARFLSKEFATAAGVVLAANGVQVTLSDRIVPTPVVSFHCLMQKYDLGIMITASHNPGEFNGLKIKTSEGAAADNELTNKVEQLLRKTEPKQMGEEEAKKKNLLATKDLTSSYVSFLRKFINLTKIKKLHLKVLVDTMYGAGDNFGEKVLGKSNITIDYLHNEYNPSFGGIHPEPVQGNVKELITAVKRKGYDLGIVLDGDADRVAAVDGKGNFINAQRLLPLLALHMYLNRGERGGIGKTVVGSNMIDKVASSLGVPCYETPVGFKYISNLFREKLIFVGGEEAGGIGFKGYIPERDGSVSFLLLLEMIAVQKQPFDQLLTNLYRRYGKWWYGRCSLPVKTVKKNLADLKVPSRLCGKPVERVNTLDGVKIIARECWLMLRKSGTEPIVRVYAESKRQGEVQQLLAVGKKMIHDL